TIPARGCEPDGFGFDSPNNSATTGGMFSGLNGLFLLGTPDPTSAFPQQSTGFRKQHTDFQPVYQYDEEVWEASFNYDFDKFSINIGGGYQTADYLSQQDYKVDVGYNMAP